MRRAKKQSGGSLDSLLDTMTNAVGMLLIVLTVTQLGVADAVKRIDKSGRVDPKDFDAAKEDLAALMAKRDQLQQELATVGAVDAAKKLLQSQQKKVKSAEDDVERLKKRSKDLAEEAKKLLAAAQKLLEEQKQKEEELIAKITQGAAEIAKLRARLADIPAQPPVPPKVIYLPNPRAAPEGAKALTVFCRDNRVIPVDIDGYRSKAQKLAKFIVKNKGLGRDPQAGIDGKALVRNFNEAARIGDRNIDVRLEVRGPTPVLVFKRRTNAGETPQELSRRASWFQRGVWQVPPDKYYLRFMVWPDSFEVYLEARKITADRGLAAGWELSTSPDEYTIALGGDIRCGPPPKPQPPSAQPAKPAPKPAPKPSQPERKAPVDQID